MPRHSCSHDDQEHPVPSRRARQQPWADRGQRLLRQCVLASRSRSACRSAPRSSSGVSKAVARLEGQNVTYAFIDEVTDCDEQTFNDVNDRIGRELNRATGRFYPGRIWAVGNPPDIGLAHWRYRRFYKDFEDAGEVNTPGSGVFCQYISTFDNPLSEDKRAHYEKVYGYSEIERQRKLPGRFVNRDGLLQQLVIGKAHRWP